MSQDSSAAAKGSNSNVTITDNVTGKEATFPVMTGTDGPGVIDIRRLYAETGYFTYDPGFVATGSCESKITYIDGDNGILLHRGYPIDQLAENSDFLEVCYLLLYGELPNGAQKTKFDHDITYHTMLHEQMANFYRGFRRDAHPMAIMCGVVGAMAAFYHDSTDISDPHQRMVASYRMIAKMPTIAGWAYKYSIGQPFIYPSNKLGFAENFLHMLFATPCEDYVVNPIVAKAMDRILILHADHEQNASTSTVRLAGSSGANPFACVSAGIASLWGPAHGGANEAVLNMLAEIGNKSNINEFIKKAKDPDDPFRLMGFGHRVYKNFDPRATIIKESCAKLLHKREINDPIFDIAQELEEVALSDDYFIERKLYPNVDFYSGVIYRAIGIPESMFTVLFAMGRLPGWIAHWKEMHASPGKRICRPRQVYTGEQSRAFTPIDQR